MQLLYSYDWPGNPKELALLLNEITATITNETTITQNMHPLHFLFKTKHYINYEQSLFVPSTKQDLVPSVTIASLSLHINYCPFMRKKHANQYEVEIKLSISN